MARDRFPPPLTRALLVLSVTQIAAWGTLFYGIALLGPRIAAQMGWSDALVYGGFGGGLLAAGLTAPFLGRVIDRRGGRKVMAAGSLVAALGFVLLATARSPAAYLLAWVVAGASMAAVLYDPAFATLSRVAGRHTRVAISLLTLAGGFASTVSWPLTLYLLGQWDWRSVALAYGALNALLCAPLHAILLPDDRVAVPVTPEPDGQDRPREAPPLIGGRRRTVALVLFGLVVTSHGFVTSALSVHLVRLLDMLGMSEAQAVLAGACIGPAQVGARLLEVLFGRRLDAMALGLLATGLLPGAFVLLLALAATPATAIAFALLYGASNGLITIARGVVPHALFGPERYGETLGRLAAPTLVTKATAPLVFAVFMTGWGSVGTLTLCGTLAVAAFAAMLALARVRRLSPSVRV
jgi:predicted MFS family arabinose efflux permease